MINLFLNFYINIQVAGQIVMVNITNLITHCEGYMNRGEHRLNTHLGQEDTNILMAGVVHYMFSVKCLDKKNPTLIPPAIILISAAEYQNYQVFQKWTSVHCILCSCQCMAFFLSCLLFLSEAHTTESVFTSSDLEIQSITLQDHRKHHTALICRPGFHHLLICIYCKSVYECCVARHIPRCVFCQLLSLAAFFPHFHSS